MGTTPIGGFRFLIEMFPLGFANLKEKFVLVDACRRLFVVLVFEISRCFLILHSGVPKISSFLDFF